VKVNWAQDREFRAWVLRKKASKNPHWLYDMAQAILNSDPQKRTLEQLLLTIGTALKPGQEIAYFGGPEADVPQVVQIKRTDREAVFLKVLMRLIADGQDVRELLNISKPPKIGHRPTDPLVSDIALEVEQLLNEGDTVSVAYQAVADITGRSYDAVRMTHLRHRPTNKS
jgi:hypothetical protein